MSYVNVIEEDDDMILYKGREDAEPDVGKQLNSHQKQQLLDALREYPEVIDTQPGRTRDGVK